jgi:hypothetical protein
MAPAERFDHGEIAMKSIHLALAAALLAAGTSASAQTATDARCLMLSNAFAKQSKEANQQKLAEDSIYFYLGRIAGQPSAAQMKTLFDEQAKTITDANASTLMGDCVKTVLAKVELLQSMATQPQPATKPPAKPQRR